MEKRALGKGLAALIGEKQGQVFNRPVPLFTVEPRTKGEVTFLELDKLTPGRFQPRVDFDDQKLQELIASIKEKGVLQPILARKTPTGFEVIAGERRYRAAKALKLDKIPAIVKDVKDEEALVISLIENIQRQELNPIEEAHAFQQLAESFNFSQDNIAQAVGKDKTTISNILRLLKLPMDIQKYISKGDITIGHAKALLATEDVEKQRNFCKMVIANSLSVRELENLVTAGLPMKKRRAQVARTSDPHVAHLERTLQHSLGTKVRIIAHKKRGKIIIEFYSPQDLERIVNILKKR